MKNRQNHTNKYLLSITLCAVLLAACSSSDPMEKVAGSTNLPDTSEPVQGQPEAMPEEMAEQSATDNTPVAMQPMTPTTTPTSTPETPTVPETPIMSGPEAALAAIEHAALFFIAEETGPSGLTVSASANFHELATPLENDPVLQAMTMLDTCEVGSESSQINADALNLPIDHVIEAIGNEILQVTSISAGETIELGSAEGSYVSLVQDTSNGVIEYVIEAGTELTMIVPDELNIDISGDAFPQLQSTWATPARLDAGLRGGVRSITSSSVLTWDAAQTSDAVQSRVHIYAGFLDELTGEFNSYQCELEDDGEFTLPADVQALYANGLSANFVDVARYSRNVQLVNGISVVNVFLQRF